MRIKGFVRPAAFLAAAVLLWTGCASTPGTVDSDGAVTPQDKAHQQQLADMGARDADQAEKPAPREKRLADPSVRGRRIGQRVIDQPSRR